MGRQSKSAKSVREDKIIIADSSATHNLLPRGLQIIANDTERLDKGFPYPDVLSRCSITKDKWNAFCAVVGIGSATSGEHMSPVAYSLEDTLDFVADWDVRYFRPRGLIMRVDMPGEEKYGLYFMDIYHPEGHDKHVDNVHGFTQPADVAVSTSPSSVLKEKGRGAKHTRSIGAKAFCSTRIMLDSIKVLENQDLAMKRGWTNSIKACNDAARLKKEFALPPVRNNEPWDFSKLSPRRDRWPPSKHLYYERSRRHVVRHRNSESSPCSIHIPDWDSMDQRTWGPCSIVSCDEVEFKILRNGEGMHPLLRDGA